MCDSIGQQSISFEDFCKLYKELLASNRLGNHLLKTLHHKLENEIFDAGDYFCLTPDEKKGGALKVVVSNEDGVKHSGSHSVFLIDHAWTYKSMDARKELCDCPGLLPRIAQMMGYSVHGEVFSPEDDIVNNVLNGIWKYNQNYSISTGTPDENLPFWYILDEFGSCIRHSDSSSVLLFPFFYQPKQTCFSIMCLLDDLDYGDEVTRDYANYEEDVLIRKCKLLPWFPEDLTAVPGFRIVFPDEKYEERYAVANETQPVCTRSCVGEKRRLKVYMEVLNELLNDVASFEIVDDEPEADVLITSRLIKDYQKLSLERPDLFVCQFPCEQLMICKDFFADIAMRVGDDVDDKGPSWLPTTFDLRIQFPNFVSRYQQRAKFKGDENIWIVKPLDSFNHLEIYISNNLDALVRQRDTNSPKIISKYIEDPVLLTLSDQYSMVKFSLRYFVLVKSIKPLKMHVCELFIPKFASKTFELNDFDELQRHFTTLQYSEEIDQVHITPQKDFIQRFENQYRDRNWSNITGNIHQCIFEFMKGATSRAPPYGVGHYVNSRSIYSFNVMLRWESADYTDEEFVQPTLLGCDFMPDLTTACKISPPFLSEVFRFLFLEDESCQVTDISDLS